VMKIARVYGFILALTCFLAAEVFAQGKQGEEKSLTEVLPDAVRFEAVKSAAGEIIYYQAFDKNNAAAGVAFKARGKGYFSTIETMAGMDAQGKLTAIKVLNQDETPGLGGQVVDVSFTSRFRGKNISDLNSIQAITGATISSRAVIDSVKKKAEEVRSLLKE
jgi:Na+-translocating ferredoxin:NAD+ oxidoreductase subunit G